MHKFFQMLLKNVKFGFIVIIDTVYTLELD